MNPATFLISTFLRITKFKAITMPWGRVYALPEYINDKALQAHEAVHLKQIKRLGGFRWSVLYIYYLCCYGYWNSPLEVEARNNS